MKTASASSLSVAPGDEALHVGFEITELLYPHGAGSSTYARELLGHLLRLDSVRVTLIVQDYGYSRQLSVSPTQLFPGADEAWTRILIPQLGSINGRWRNDYRSRRLVHAFDRRLMAPLARWVDGSPGVARFRLPKSVRARLDVCHWPFSSALWLPKMTHVVTMHDAIPLLRHQEMLPSDDSRRLARFQHQAARRASRIIVDSESTRTDVVGLLGVPPDRIDVIPLAVGPEFQPPTDRDSNLQVLAHYGLAPDKYILSVGTIEPRKNFVRLAQAFKQVLERHPDSPLRLVIAGKRGWLTREVDDGLAELGLHDRLLLLDYVPREHLPALMNASRAFAYVSLYEGFGIPPLEAMACGAPVIASGTSSVPEVVGDAALSVDPTSVEEIAAAIQRLVTDDALRAELVERGVRRARSFSWERTAEMTVETYRKAVAGAGSLQGAEATRMGAAS